MHYPLKKFELLGATAQKRNSKTEILNLQENSKVQKFLKGAFW